jgi:hypothetical protein
LGDGGGMLIPRFSIRRVLGVTAIAALVLLLVRLGLQGQLWAAAISAAVIFGLVTFVIYAAFFGVVWLLSEMSPRVRQMPVRYSSAAHDSTSPKEPEGSQP